MLPIDFAGVIGYCGAAMGLNNCLIFVGNQDSLITDRFVECFQWM